MRLKQRGDLWIAVRPIGDEIGNVFLRKGPAHCGARQGSLVVHQTRDAPGGRGIDEHGTILRTQALKQRGGVWLRRDGA